MCDIERKANFWTALFGFAANRTEGDRIVDLIDPQGGASLIPHPAG